MAAGNAASQLQAVLSRGGRTVDVPILDGFPRIYQNN
jgi:hypothetical protein